MSPPATTPTPPTSPATRRHKRSMARSLAVREATKTYAELRVAHPDAHCELVHDNAFQLLVSVVLSAQTTDVAVNQLTPALFRRWPGPEALASADLHEVEQALSRIGMFRQKAKNITRLAQKLVQDHGGEVPSSLEALIELPGVGRKTANCVLGVAFGTAVGVVVDTHVQRLAQRLGWSRRTTPEQIEADLMKIFPQTDWPMLAHTLIFHGRRVCTARAPQCLGCPVASRCPNAFKAERVGRKPPKPARAVASAALLEKGKRQRKAPLPARSTRADGGRRASPRPRSSV